MGLTGCLTDQRELTGTLCCRELELPQQVSAAKPSLPNPRGLPRASVEHGHAVMEFQEPEHFKGEAVIRHRKHARTETVVSQAG
ncbi:uncharacterized protein LOC120467157 [Tachysurus ichikawai]